MSHSGKPLLIDEESALKLIESYPNEISRLLNKGFDIKRLQMEICQRLINRHKVLLDLRSDGLETQMSRLSQAHAGEFFIQAQHAQSNLVKVNSMARLFAILPPRLSVQNLDKVFDTSSHGYAYQSAFRQFSQEPACLMMIQTNFCEDVIIGAVLCGMDSPKSGITGNGESFVFRIECEVESWWWHQSKQTQFVHFSPGGLTIGNGAITLDEDLKNCSTIASEVFSSPNLLSRSDDFKRFQVTRMEIFTFSSFESN